MKNMDNEDQMTDEVREILKRRSRFRVFCLILFAVYVLAIVYFLLFSDMYGRTAGYSQYRYNLVPFLEIKRFIHSMVYYGSISLKDVFINVAGNVVAFIPFGALLRWARNKKTNMGIAVLTTFLFSLGIETIQLITKVGVFDVDDLILNTAGGAIGFLIYLALRHIVRKREENGKKI